MAQKLEDFFINIFGKVDTNGVDKMANKLTALNTSALVLDKAFGYIGKGFRSFIDTAKETAELGRLAKDLGTSVQFVDRFQRLFELAGGTADNAVNVIRTLNETVTAMKFGEVNEYLARLGIFPKFTTDIQHNLLAIREIFNQLQPMDKSWLIKQIGLNEETLRILRLSDSEYKRLNNEAKQYGLLSTKQVDDAAQFQSHIVEAEQAFRSFKREMVSDLLPQAIRLTDNLIAILKDPNTKAIIDGLSKITIGGANVAVKGVEATVDALNVIKPIKQGIDWIKKDYAEYKKKHPIKGEIVEARSSYTTSQNTNAATNIVTNNVNVTTNATPKEIGDEVDKRVRTIFKQQAEKHKSGVVS